MSKTFQLSLLIGILAGSSLGAQASTMVYSYEGSASVSIPDQYSDLNAIWESDSDFQAFSGTVIIPNYENYLTGTHVVNLNSNGLQVSLENGLLTGIEGVRSFVQIENPDYDPSLPSCSSRRGCDLDGDGVFETPGGTNPETIFQGAAVLPDDTQVGNEGSVTIVDGEIVSFNWSATGTDSEALAVFNERIFDNGGFPVNIESIVLEVLGSTAAILVGDAYYSVGVNGLAEVTMIDTASPVPVPAALPLLLSGMALLGGISRRRLPAAG